MATRFEALQFATSQMHRESWLLYLNYLLDSKRSGRTDKSLCPDIGPASVPPHVIHFLSKLIVDFGQQYAGQRPTWDWYIELRDAVINLEDPIQDDPDWKTSDPTGFFIRLSNQQFPAQETRRIQRIGLAAGLFRDLSPLSNGYDLAAKVQDALGMPLSHFFALGSATMSFQRANWEGNPCQGTFNREYLQAAGNQGVFACLPDYWEPYLERVAIRPEDFRVLSDTSDRSAFNERYPQFAFNHLRQRPIIETSPDHFIAPDPYLIIERTSLGVFYDLFERDRTDFTQNFGLCFERFIEQLIRSKIADRNIWTSECWDSPNCNQKPPSKLVDIVVRGTEYLVLFECKSIRASLELACEASDEAVERMKRRLIDAIVKATEHAESIAKGEWLNDGLFGKRFLCVVVTYGKLYAANAPFIQRAIMQDERLAGKSVPSWVILSLDELDTAVSLVDDGDELESVVATLCSDESSFDPLQQHYGHRLRHKAVSAFTFDKGKSVLDSLIR